MDFNKRKANSGLVCTCNNLYREEIIESIEAGYDDAKDVMFDHDTQFKCCECKPIVDALIKKYSKSI